MMGEDESKQREEQDIQDLDLESEEGQEVTERVRGGGSAQPDLTAEK